MSDSVVGTKSVIELTEPPPAGTKAVLLFWAPWHEATVAGGVMDQVLQALAASSSVDDRILFGKVHAEEQTALTAQYQVKAIPTFVLLSVGGTVVDKIEGDNVATVTQAVQRLLQLPKTTLLGTDNAAAVSTTNTAVVKDQQDTTVQLHERLQALIQSAPVMLFMKGTPVTPKCGFSRQVVELLQEERIPFHSFDILTDDAVRQGLKTYSNWPTYPQLYVNAELVGGLDILQEMKQEGSLRQQLSIPEDQVVPETAVATLDGRLRELVRRSTVMLFMKGLPSAPKCGFSRTICDILSNENIPYDAFDILQDEDVRQGLKAFSNWPTYPQLYVNGELIGGLDIVKEMMEESGPGQLKESLGL